MSFNVGDFVRLADDATLDGRGHEHGSVGVIVRVDDDDVSYPYEVSVNGREGWYGENELLPEVNPVKALEIPAPGISSAELAAYTARTIEAVSGRIKGVGNEQYATPEGQQFEKMTPDALLQYAREEAQDLVSYGVMLDIRLARVQAALNAKGLGE